MKIILKRVAQVGDATIGKLEVLVGEGANAYVNFGCYTLEDIGRDEKVHGQTRIPAGLYEVKYREVVSAKTEQYRKKYPFFKWHLELQDVPNYQYVYIHVGNKAADTEGCILVGSSWDGKSPFIGSSGVAYSALYPMVKSALERRESVFIDIRDTAGV